VVFSRFLLTQTATTVIFGKLADIYGRKPVIVVGTIIFLSGSILCGFAWSMGIDDRVPSASGVGAGSMQPIAVTIAGRLLCRSRALGNAGLAVVGTGRPPR
jgi:MFS family permease